MEVEAVNRVAYEDSTTLFESNTVWVKVENNSIGKFAQYYGLEVECSKCFT